MINLQRDKYLKELKDNGIRVRIIPPIHNSNIFIELRKGPAWACGTISSEAYNDDLAYVYFLMKLVRKLEDIIKGADSSGEALDCHKKMSVVRKEC